MLANGRAALTCYFDTNMLTQLEYNRVVSLPQHDHLFRLNCRLYYNNEILSGRPVHTHVGVKARPKTPVGGPRGALKNRYFCQEHHETPQA